MRKKTTSFTIKPGEILKGITGVSMEQIRCLQCSAPFYTPAISFGHWLLQPSRVYCSPRCREAATVSGHVLPETSVLSFLCNSSRNGELPLFGMTRKIFNIHDHPTDWK